MRGAHVQGASEQVLGVSMEKGKPVERYGAGREGEQAGWPLLVERAQTSHSQASESCSAVRLRLLCSRLC
jgi:hypothetical protein